MSNANPIFEYTEESIKSLDWREHIRLRPGMYIGKLGDGSAPDDGIYVLIKEVIDNCIDEHMMGYGKQIELTIEDQTVYRARLWQRHPAGQTGGCGEQDKYRREIRQQSVSKKCGIEWRGNQSSECTERLF